MHQDIVYYNTAKRDMTEYSVALVSVPRRVLIYRWLGCVIVDMPLLKASDSYVHYTLSEVPSLTISTISVFYNINMIVSLNTFKNLTKLAYLTSKIYDTQWVTYNTL